MTFPHVTEIRPALEPVVADPFVSDLARPALRGGLSGSPDELERSGSMRVSDRGGPVARLARGARPGERG